MQNATLTTNSNAAQQLLFQRNISTGFLSTSTFDGLFVEASMKISLRSIGILLVVVRHLLLNSCSLRSHISITWFVQLKAWVFL